MHGVQVMKSWRRKERRGGESGNVRQELEDDFGELRLARSLVTEMLGTCVKWNRHLIACTCDSGTFAGGTGRVGNWKFCLFSGRDTGRTSESEWLTRLLEGAEGDVGSKSCRTSGQIKDKWHLA